MIYTVTFNPAIDYVVYTPELELGSVNRSEKEEIQFGGKGINASVVLHRLGVENVALGFLAGFTGRAIEEGLREMGVATDFIALERGNTRINVKIKGSRETEINGCGPAISQGELQCLFQKLDAIRDGDMLVLAGSIPNSLPDDIYENILERLREKKILVAVDATGDLLVNVLKYHPFLIKPNNFELGEIFGVEPKSAEEIKHYAKELQAMGARNVLVSMAGDGAVLLDEKGGYHEIGVPKGKVKNSVGAGDSMVAGFLAGYLERGDFAYALKLGTATGSATAFSEGLATKAEVIALLDTL